jgi:superfamily II DNA or RNA helicase
MLRVTEKPWNILIQGDSIEVHYVQNKFSFEHPSKDVMIRKTGGRLQDWDGMVKFYRKINGAFDENGQPAISVGRGMGKRLRKIIEDEDIDVDWTKREVAEPIGYHDDLLKDIELDQIQRDCLQQMLKHQVCSIELGTGSGKTEIFFMAIACFLKQYPEAKIIVVTSKKILLRELEKRFLKRLPQYADSFGLLGDGKADLKQVVIATPNSARDNSKLIHYEDIAKWKEGVDLLILDECHHARSKGWLEVVQTCQPSYLWAVSGKVTYHTSEIKTAELEAIFGPPVYVGFSKVRTVPVLVHYHYHPKWRGKFDDDALYPSLVDGCPVFYRYKEEEDWQEGCWRGPDDEGKCPEWMLIETMPAQDGLPAKYKPDKALYGIYRKDGSREVEDRLDPQPDSVNVIYWSPYDMGVMEFSEFNRHYADLVYRLSQKKEKWLISVRRSRQIYKWKKTLAKYPDVRVGFVDGSISGQKQLAIFEKLEKGELDGVVSQYTISAEGVDVPSLLHFIKLDGLSSEQLLEQQKGRVERIADGKALGTIHVPSMSQHSSLDKAFQKIKKYYTELRKLEYTKTTHK